MVQDYDVKSDINKIVIYMGLFLLQSVVCSDPNNYINNQ